MSSEDINVINIKNLTEIEEVVSGNQIIIETADGTRIIDYANFIIGLDNTTFGDTITGNSADIAELDTKVDSLSTQVGIDIANSQTAQTSANRFHFDKLTNTSVNANGNTVLTFSQDMPAGAQAEFGIGNVNINQGSTVTLGASGFQYYVSAVGFVGDKPQVTIIATGGSASGTFTLHANIMVPY